MIIFVTTKQEQRDYEADFVDILGTFHTLNQAQDAAQEDTTGDALTWKEFGTTFEAEATNFTAEYSVTRHKVPKAVFSE